MKRISLKRKLLLMFIFFCVFLGGINIIGMSLLSDVSSEFKSVSSVQFPKLKIASSLVSKFRLIRINIRSLSVEGISETQRTQYIEDTKLAISSYLEEKKKFDGLEFTADEKLIVTEMNDAWSAFYEFGKDLLAQYENMTPESKLQGAYMVREVCPVKASAWISLAQKFVSIQDQSVTAQVLNTSNKQQKVTLIAYLLTLVTSLIFLFIGQVFTSKISNKIEELGVSLKEVSEEVNNSSQEVLLSGTQLSEASTEAASSLQETVASIDEISSMIQRNADAANTSTDASLKSSRAANRGKKTVESMIESIEDISQSNDEIALEMQKNNQDFTKIIRVISEIGEKTKVINDIVFQTKLLSFNASVEAARAGEHGKGFAVVAEEVGNLASMSGKAALEITEMLDSSTKEVTEIIENTKKKVELLVSNSKHKVEIGTKTANECGEALDEILQNVTSVNEMVREIATASNEQATGVQEVTKAMQQLDQTTHQNSTVAQESNLMAKRLKGQSDFLNEAVIDLLEVVTGAKRISFQEKSDKEKTKSNTSSRTNQSNQMVPESQSEDGIVDDSNKVLTLPVASKTASLSSNIERKASGFDLEIPDESDDRFEDL